jgi:hypothetical protein
MRRWPERCATATSARPGIRRRSQSARHSAACGSGRSRVPRVAQSFATMSISRNRKVPARRGIRKLDCQASSGCAGRPSSRPDFSSARSRCSITARPQTVAESLLLPCVTRSGDAARKGACATANAISPTGRKLFRAQGFGWIYTHRAQGRDVAGHDCSRDQACGDCGVGQRVERVHAEQHRSEQARQGGCTG